jgi:F-type H+-transporting ATPase subunit a
MKGIYIIIWCLAFFLIPLGVRASESHDEAGEEEFNVNEVIMDHIKDSYEWHILDYKKDGETHPLVVSFPVILIGNGQFDIFMASEFHHGAHHVTKGSNEYILHEGKIYFAGESKEITYTKNDKGEEVISNDKPIDLSITKNVVGIFIVALLMLWIFISVAKSYKKRPGRPAGLQALMEPMILFVKNDLVIPNVGEHKADKYLPYLLTVFFFILFCNLLGLVPFFLGGANITGNIAVTFTLALFTMIFINVFANRNYWKHIFSTPGVPIWLYPIMIPVELIGIVIKPFALMIRLFANITAGHIIVLSLVSIIFIFKSAVMASVAIPLGLFMSVLEILVAFLQAYVFTLLSALFIGMSVQQDH